MHASGAFQHKGNKPLYKSSFGHTYNKCYADQFVVGSGVFAGFVEDKEK